MPLPFASPRAGYPRNRPVSFTGLHIAMLLQFIHKGSTKLAIEVYDDAGQLIHQRLINRYNENNIKALSRIAGWDIPTTNQNVNTFCEQEEDETAAYDFEPSPALLQEWTGVEPEAPPPVEETQPFVLHIRELTQSKRTGIAYQDFDAGNALYNALTDTTHKWTEPVIEWTEKDRLACLDVDYHTAEPPSETILHRIASSIRPQPYLWHPSHGGGAKLYYVSHPGYNATELASVAGLQWVQQDPRATFDIIKQTRHPGYTRTRDDKEPPCKNPADICVPKGSGDVSPLKRLLASEVNSDDIEEFLQERGWKIGMMLPHSECIIDPGGSSDESKDSIFIGDAGLFCHRCYQRGLGGKTPGFTSFASLLPGVDNRIRNMVKHFTHLEHARVVLNNIFPAMPQHVLDNVYRVMMKILHPHDDPRIHMAMHAGEGFVRIKGQWVDTDGEVSLTDGLNRYVQSLPAVLNPTQEGFAVNIPRMTAFLNAGDLEEHGYPSISYIRGCKIYGQFLPYPHDEVVKSVVRREFRECPPKYLPKSRRLSSDDAWGLLDQEFPGINQRYMKLLIATKGVSEGRLAQCPFLMITGVSSGGKSTTAHVAAGICGDKADEPLYNNDPVRFRASLVDAARTSGFVCVNEVFKAAKDLRLTPVQALNPMLTLTEDSRSHVLYVGSVPFGRLPVFVLTDINCPPEITQDYQLARRFTFFRLDSSIDWTPSLVANNIRPHEFRLISYNHALAADTILSEVIDEFFQEPTPLTEICKRLGIDTASAMKMIDPKPDKKTIREVVNTTNTEVEVEEDNDDELSERVELRKQLVKLYHNVLLAPKLTGADAARYDPEKGWKKVDRLVKNDILEVWESVCDGTQGNEWGVSRIVDAEDWGKLLGLKFPVVMDVSPYPPRQHRCLYVRFRSADSKKRPIWINGERTKWAEARSGNPEKLDSNKPE